MANLHPTKVDYVRLYSMMDMMSCLPADLKCSDLWQVMLIADNVPNDTKGFTGDIPTPVSIKSFSRSKQWPFVHFLRAEKLTATHKS